MNFINSKFCLAGKLITISKPLQKKLLDIGKDSFRIVSYHMVTSQPPGYYFKDKTITPETFKEQVRFFKKNYKIISLYDAVERTLNGKSLAGYLSITTDDGFSENYKIMAPILREEKVTAAFFIIESCLDNRMLMWRNKLIYLANKLKEKETFTLLGKFARGKKIPTPRKGENIMPWSFRTWPMIHKDQWSTELWHEAKLGNIADFLAYYQPYMTTQQIKELINENFQVGSHSKTHPDCSKLNYKQLENEIIGSLAGLSGKLNMKIDLFSYPFKYRAAPFQEQRIISNYSGECKMLLGIKNKLANFANPYEWERDLQEFAPDMALLRFMVLPILRKRKLTHK